MCSAAQGAPAAAHDDNVQATLGGEDVFPRFNCSQWTPSEEATLLRGREVGHSWEQIAAKLPGRTSDSVRNRAQKLHAQHKLPLAPVKDAKGWFSDNARMWEQEEDAHIIRNVALIGKSWRLIASGLKDRSDSAVRNRYNRLVAAGMTAPERMEGTIPPAGMSITGCVAPALPIPGHMPPGMSITGCVAPALLIPGHMPHALPASWLPGSLAGPHVTKAAGGLAQFGVTVALPMPSSLPVFAPSMALAPAPSMAPLPPPTVGCKRYVDDSPPSTADGGMDDGEDMPVSTTPQVANLLEGSTTSALLSDPLSAPLTLAEMAAAFKRKLGLPDGLTLKATVVAACAHYGVPTSGHSLMEQAIRCTEVW